MQENEQQILFRSLKTDNTKTAATKAVKKLERYLTENNHEKELWLESLRDEKKYTVLQEYVSWLDMMPNSIKQNFAMIKKYLRIVHDIKLNIDDQKYIMNFPDVLEIDREPMTVDKIRQLCNHSNDYYRALWLVLSSSGMRISEALLMTPEMVDFEADPVMVRLPAKLTKTKKKRITFLSSEAVDCIQKIDFFNTHTLNAVETYFGQLRKRANLIKKYDDSNNYTANIHAFRSFFRTQAGKVSVDFAEQVMGHAGYLKQYVRLSDSEKTAYYKKTEPKLKIFS